MTGASVNFKPVMSAQSAVSHADRTVPPKYLLASKLSLGTIVVLDDNGKVAQTLDAKMALASRQARAAKNFSPVWEGVLNLPRPDIHDPKFDVAKYKNHCIEITKSWIDEYQKATNHIVLRADIHLDEGHIEDGKTLLNAHAHIISDKTNERGKVFIINRIEMRALQDMTAKVTQLERGKDSIKTGRKHLNPIAYKSVAKGHGLEVKAAVKKEIDGGREFTKKLMSDRLEALKEVVDLKAQIAILTAQIEADYKANRAAMVASKTATQADYKALKEAKDKEIAEIKAKLAEAQTEAAKVPALEATITSQTAAFESLKVEAMAVITPLRKEVKTMATQITQLEADKDQLSKDLAQAQRAAVLAENYQAEKAKGTPAHLIVPDPVPRTSQSNKPEVRTPAPVIGPNERARLRALEATQTTLEAPKQVQGVIPSPTPSKSPREAFMALYEGVKLVLVGMIDGMRLDAAQGRLGLFSSHNSAGPRVQVLCEVPENKVMPEIGKTFDGRARSGKGGIGD